MKKVLLTLCLIVMSVSFASANEQDLINQQRLEDLTQLQLDLKKDRELMAIESLEQMLGTKSLNHDCDDDRPHRPGRGGGSAACWNRCNYSLSTCASTCGIETPAAQAACWGKCNYSISTCASTCGVSTGRAQRACWGSCNYSLSTCASSCGVDTRGGSEACWNRCNYSQSTCASTCGTN